MKQREMDRDGLECLINRFEFLRFIGFEFISIFSGV